ncbi:MAG: VCBS repeat-containing protein [bacterium]|nr:VCBS repeat-containing protein [bacterium]
MNVKCQNPNAKIEYPSAIRNPQSAILIVAVSLLLSTFFFTGIGKTQGIDLPGLVADIANQVEQQLGSVGGSVYEVRKDAIYLYFSDPSRITLRSRFYLYSASDTAVPPNPIAELEITRLSRQYPAGRIIRTYKYIPVRKGDRVVTAPEKLAIIGLGDEGRIQLISEMLAGQLTASGKYTATASVELSRLWQKKKLALYSMATDTVTLATLNVDTIVAQQLLKETDYTAIIVSHWERGDSGNQLICQLYRYGSNLVQEPVSVLLENNLPLSQLLFLEATKPITSLPEPKITEVPASPSNLESQTPPMMQDATAETGPVQLLTRVPLGYQILGLAAGNIDKDNQAELVVFSPTAMKLFKWAQTTLVEYFSQKYGAELPSARTRDWIRHATVVENWQTVIIYHSGDTKSEVYEWKNNQFRLLTQLDHLALGSLRNPEGKTMVVAADLLPNANLYCKDSIYMLFIDPNGTVETQTFQLPSNFYSIAGGYPAQENNPVWFVMNEHHQMVAYNQSFAPRWSSETTYGNALVVIPSTDSTDLRFIGTSSAIYGENDTIYGWQWNNGNPQLWFSYPISGSVSQLAAADINGDGITELIIVSDEIIAGKIRSTLLVYQIKKDYTD